jgi:hypothetical protein
MKVVAVLAIHRREEITRLTLERLKRQTVDLEIAVAGDSEIEVELAREAGVHYVEHPNLPLAAKYQAAVNLARTLSPDAIVTTGSDSWISDNWCEVALEEMLKHGWDSVGKNEFAAMNLDTMEIVERRYKSNRADKPDGNGRMVLAKGMEKLGWQLYPAGFKGLDGIDNASYQQCLRAGLRCGIMNHRSDVKVMEIKSGAWGSVNGFHALKTSPSLDHLPAIPSANFWLDRFFPESYDVLKELSWKISSP